MMPDMLDLCVERSWLRKRTGKMIKDWWRCSRRMTKTNYRRRWDHIQGLRRDCGIGLNQARRCSLSPSNCASTWPVREEQA